MGNILDGAIAEVLATKREAPSPCKEAVEVKKVSKEEEKRLRMKAEEKARKAREKEDRLAWERISKAKSKDNPEPGPRKKAQPKGKAAPKKTRKAAKTGTSRAPKNALRIVGSFSVPCDMRKGDVVYLMLQQAT